MVPIANVLTDWFYEKKKKGKESPDLWLLPILLAKNTPTVTSVKLSM